MARRSAVVIAGWQNNIITMDNIILIDVDDLLFVWLPNILGSVPQLSNSYKLPLEPAGPRKHQRLHPSPRSISRWPLGGGIPQVDAPFPLLLCWVILSNFEGSEFEGVLCWDVVGPCSVPTTLFVVLRRTISPLPILGFFFWRCFPDILNCLASSWEAHWRYVGCCLVGFQYPSAPCEVLMCLAGRSVGKFHKRIWFPLPRAKVLLGGPQRAQKRTSPHTGFWMLETPPLAGLPIFPQSGCVFGGSTCGPCLFPPWQPRVAPGSSRPISRGPAADTILIIA